MSPQKTKSLVIALSISLALSISAPQSAIADNLPADSAYSENINKFYNLEFIPADANYGKFLLKPAGTFPRTGAKYKSWLKQTNASIGKISASLSKLTALSAGPSYTKSDAQLKIYIAAYSKYLIAVKKSLSKKKAVKSDQISLTSLADETGIQADKWNTLYGEEFTDSNFSAPTTNPTVSFFSADDPTGGKILYASLANNTNFDQQALRITSYDIEWYVGSTTSTPIPSSADVEAIKASTYAFSLTGVVAGGAYFLRIASVNAAGKGTWSTFYQTTS
jgi:hypothetical protein